MSNKGCPKCGYKDCIDSGKDSRIVIEKDKIHSTHEVICKNCGCEYGLRFVQGEYIGFESVEL